MFNIFQGNNLIKRTIAKALGYDENQEYSRFTSDMYFQTFFYLSKRFGNPSFFDDYKEAGAWAFNVKAYVIEIRMNSSWVEFMMYGKIGNTRVSSPYTVKYMRERLKKRDLVINEFGNWNEKEEKIAKALFDSFLTDNKVEESITQEQFDEQFGKKWFEKIRKYNNSIINVDYDSILKLYGNDYQNSYTRNAIRTLNKFLNNLLTPIWIRDVAYNIKGRLSDKDAMFYERYRNNIKIEFRSTNKKLK